MLILDGDEDYITDVIRVHWVMKRKRLMVLTRKEVDESTITDGTISSRAKRLLSTLCNILLTYKQKAK